MKGLCDMLLNNIIFMLFSSIRNHPLVVSITGLSSQIRDDYLILADILKYAWKYDDHLRFIIHLTECDIEVHNLSLFI
jgi:hypothetical protein